MREPELERAAGGTMTRGGVTTRSRRPLGGALGAARVAGGALGAARVAGGALGARLAVLSGRGRRQVALAPATPEAALRAVRRAAVTGVVGSLAIAWGASQPSSPFTLKEPGSWFFGIPPAPLVQNVVPAPGKGLFLGIVAVYGGMILMIRAWYRVVRATNAAPGMPVRRLVPLFVAWVLPLLVVAPLFSRDVYSYVAQGEMMSRHIDPYRYGPEVLGVNPFVNLVDPMWRNVTSPYGPFFLWLAGAVMTLTGHQELAAVVVLRLVELAGTVLFAAFVPGLARSYGRDGATAFALVALSPLVLLHLVAGAHNDALMLGFMVAGLAVARRGRPVLGVVLVSLAVAVKVPAALAVVYIGWNWLGDGRSWRARVRPVASALLLCGATVAVLSALVGLGWGWVGALGDPGTVRSWLDVPTALGMLAGKAVAALGLGDHTTALVTVTRGLGFLLAGAIGVRLLWRSDRSDDLRAMGLTFLAVVAFGPVAQPWYLSWGLVVYAVVAVGRAQSLVRHASAAASFIGLPGGWVLLDQLGSANPWLLGAAAVLLVVLLAAPLVARGGSGRAGGATRDGAPGGRGGTRVLDALGVPR